MKYDVVNINEKIKLARIARDLSREELGQLCKIEPNQLEQLENGQKVVELHQFIQIINALDYEISFREKTAPSLNDEERVRAQTRAIRFLSRHEYIVRGEITAAAELITETLAEVLQTETNGIWLLNEERDYLHNIDEYELSRNVHDQIDEYSKEEWPEWFKWLNSFEGARSTRKNSPTDMNEKDFESAEERERLGIQATLETTIISEGDIIGVICSEDIIEREWHADEVAFHHQIADIISVTIRNERHRKLQEDFERQQNRLHQQQRVVFEMMQHPDIIGGNVQGALDYICKVSAELYKGSSVIIWLLTEDGETMQCQSVYDTDGGNSGIFLQHLELYHFRIGEFPLYHQSLLSERVISTDDVYNDSRCGERLNLLSIEDGISSVLDAPVRTAGKLIGLISIQSENARRWTADEGVTIGEISEQVALTLINRDRIQSDYKLHMLSRAIEFSASAVFIADLRNNIKYSNPRFQQLIGRDEKVISGMNLEEIPINVESSENFLAMLKSIQNRESEWQGELEIISDQETSLWALVTVSPILDSDEQISDYVFVCEDVSELKHAQKEMEKLAFYDPLTTLVNRRLFTELLEQNIRFSQRNKNKFALLYLDLDRFKMVNDTLGHDAGDQLLRIVAERLKNCVREADTVARLGGDEFTIIIPDIKNSDDIEIVVRKIITEIRKPLPLSGKVFNITASVGISVFPDDSKVLGQLMKYADIAMYHAKSVGRNTSQFYSEELNVFSSDRLTLEYELRQALKNEEFVLYYQPIVQRKDNKIKCIEALIRWRHPEKGLVPPMAFIPLAEDIGIIKDISNWVLKRACEELKQLHQLNLPGISVSINLAAAQFSDPKLIKKVSEALFHSNLENKYLVLEITESTVMQNIERAVETMNSLKTLGVSISIDDFGTGYSSLSYIKRLPVDHIKVDRYFIKEIHNDTYDLEITTAVIGMAHNLNLEVIAEGVELLEQESILEKLKCDYHQGFLYAKPMSAEDLSRLDFR